MARRREAHHEVVLLCQVPSPCRPRGTVAPPPPLSPCPQFVRARRPRRCLLIVVLVLPVGWRVDRCCLRRSPVPHDACNLERNDVVFDDVNLGRDRWFGTSFPSAMSPCVVEFVLSDSVEPSFTANELLQGESRRGPGWGVHGHRPVTASPPGVLLSSCLRWRRFCPSGDEPPGLAAGYRALLLMRRAGRCVARNMPREAGGLEEISCVWLGSVNKGHDAGGPHPREKRLSWNVARGRCRLGGAVAGALAWLVCGPAVQVFAPGGHVRGSRRIPPFLCSYSLVLGMNG